MSNEPLQQNELKSISNKRSAIYHVCN